MSYFPRISRQSFVSNLWAHPASPSSVDDEAIGNGLQSAWTLEGGSFGTTPIDAFDNTFTSGDVRQNYNLWRESWHLIQPPGDGNEYRITKPVSNFVVGTYYTIFGRVRLPQQDTVSANDGECALYFGATAAGVLDMNNYVRIAIRNVPGANQQQAEMSEVDAGVPNTLPEVTTILNTEGYRFELLALSYNDKNTGGAFTIDSFVGTRDGAHWIFIDTVTLPTNIATFNRVGFGFQNAAAPANVLGWDFIRTVSEDFSAL